MTGADVEVGRRWAFLSNHFLVLLCIARNPDARVRDIAEEVEVTERTAQAILKDLSDARYIERIRLGRRSHYEIRRNAPLRESMVANHSVASLLDALGEGPPEPPRPRLVY